MVQKRPLFDEELYSFSSKHPRQIEHSDKLVSFPLVPPDVTLSTPGSSVEHGLVKNITGDHERSEKDKEVSVLEMGTASSRTIDDNNEETSFALSSVPPECSSPEHPKWTRNKNPDLYSLLLNYPPIKPVSIGSNHQADIPNWEIQSSNKTINSPGMSQTSIGEEAEEERFLGTRIIPMPDSDLSSDVENTRKQCICHDKGSIRCVRQHVAEANNQLRERLGPERFVKLGFCSMGEQLATRWSQNDEQLFREVVQSTPASSGTCFWNYLPEAFSTRSTRDIVSYYFNVFMLRRRAEQNRCNWMDIDSDDDDLQDYDNNYVKESSTDEEEESDIELPLDQDDIVKNDADAVDNRLTDRANCSVERSIGEDVVDLEVQDGSCMSSDTGVTSQGNQVNAENDGHWQGSSSAFTGGSDQGYVLYPCDSKVWDTGLIIHTQSKEDFAPTCSIVEQVFGDAMVKRDGDNSK